MGALYFVTGGARSGKSRFALRLAEAEARSGSPVVFVATMEALDDELRSRVARHRAARPPAWRTVEAPHSPAAALAGAEAEACVLLDCLSLWLSNLLLAAPGVEDISGDGAPAAAMGSDARGSLGARIGEEVDVLLRTIARRRGLTIVVSNEVGSGIVPASPLGRLFRDLLGSANQQVAAAAGRGWLLVAGRAVELPPLDAP